MVRISLGGRGCGVDIIFCFFSCDSVDGFSEFICGLG